MSATDEQLTMDDFEEVFLEDAGRFYGVKPEVPLSRRRRYTLTICLMARQDSEYRKLVARMVGK